MKTNIRVRLNFRSCLVAVLALAALAQTGTTVQAGHFGRNECFVSGSAGQRGRLMGERNAKRLFDNIWGRLQQRCDQLDRLAGIIAETPLAPPQTRGAFQACFYQGYVETLFANLDGASNRCSDKCFQAGSEIGRISAQGYCMASMALGGLDDPGFIAQPALPLCGFNVVMGCKSQYIETSLFEIPACRAYTEGSFYYTFENTVRQDCYVPADVPIRDRRFSQATTENSSFDTRAI